MFKFFEDLETIKFGSVSLATILSAVLIFLICLIVIKIIGCIISRLLKKSKLEKGLKSFIGSAVRIGLWALAVVIVAESLGIPTASLVATLSVAGLALSLAIQGIMSNLFSGLTLLATKPFISGEYIELNSIAGTVQAVGLFYTNILTIDNKLVYIPNSEVTSSKIQNFSRAPLRRVDLLFTASYECSTESVKKALYEAMEADDRILRDPAPFAAIMSYKSSSIEYVVRAWVKTPDYISVYFSLNESVRESFERNGVSMSYEHVNVHVVSTP
jgi:small conductance mechanosensitive channel